MPLKERTLRDPARTPPDDRNAQLRQLAHRRLDELLDDATRHRFWGVVAVEVSCQNGDIQFVHRRLVGRDKA